METMSEMFCRIDIAMALPADTHETRSARHYSAGKNVLERSSESIVDLGSRWDSFVSEDNYVRLLERDRGVSFGREKSREASGSIETHMRRIHSIPP